ncbi:MAG: polysaccharide biosynthesis tyrosine autokinase [Deltaproteobacteria bacterium]|nr:polysaccharide biosynthesis tyrosine autokinase [Deltaproteobacteria bacterium]
MELRQLIETLLRRKWVVIYIFGAVFLTIFIGTLVVTPSYDSTAKVLLRKSPASSSMLASIGLQGSSQSSAALGDTDRADYLALAAVSPVADQVITELDLKRERTRSRLMKAVPGLKWAFGLLGVDVTATLEAMTAETLLDQSLLSVIFPRPYVALEQYEDTDIIHITAYSTDPDEAMRIANAMAKYFIAEELKRVSEDYRGVKVFVDSNITKARNEYLESLNEVKQFKEKEKSLNLDTESTALLQKISDLKKSVDDNRLSLAKVSSSIRNMEGQLKSIQKYQKSSEQVKDNDMVVNLKITLRDLYLTLAETKSKYTSENPYVIDLENKIARNKELLEQELVKVYGGETISIDPVYQDLIIKLAENYADQASYQSQAKTYPKIIARYESDMMQLPGKVSAYSKLALDVTVTQDIYNSLLQSQYQVGMAESMALSNIYIVEDGKSPSRNDPTHKSPSLFLNTIIAVLLGSTFSIAAVFLIEYFDVTVKTSQDLKAFQHITFLGSVFKLKKKDSRIIDSANLKSPLRETFRSIRNSIKFVSLDKPIKSFVVTSATAGEGKTFFSSNIGISLALEGKKVLIIDGDLRRPALHKQFNQPNSKGLTNFLVGEATIEEIQVKTGVSGLSIMTTGPIPPDPAKLVESHKMQQLISDMKDIYDIVIIDAPPVLPASDAMVFGEGIVMIIESSRLSKAVLNDLFETIKKSKIDFYGVVLNKDKDYGSSYYAYYQ